MPRGLQLPASLRAQRLALRALRRRKRSTEAAVAPMRGHAGSVLAHLQTISGLQTIVSAFTVCRYLQQSPQP